MQPIMSAYLAYVLVAFLALINLAFANFDLYQVKVTYYNNIVGWDVLPKYMLFNDAPTCAGNGKDKVYYWDSPIPDLSHGRLGVRCEGSCGYDDPPWPDVQTVEMHFSNIPYHHYTIYKDKGYEANNTWFWPMYDIDGETQGECFAYGEDQFDCDWTFDGKIRQASGRRKFRCLTYLDADFINEAARKEIEDVSGSDGDMDWENTPLDNSTTPA